MTIFHFRSNLKILIKKWFIFFLRAYSSDEKITNFFSFAFFRALLRPHSPHVTVVEYSNMTIDDVMMTHSHLKSCFSYLHQIIIYQKIYYFWDYPREWMLLDWLYLSGVVLPSGQFISSRPGSEPIWPDHVTFSNCLSGFPLRLKKTGNNHRMVSGLTVVFPLSQKMTFYTVRNKITFM